MLLVFCVSLLLQKANFCFRTAGNGFSDVWLECFCCAITFCRVRPVYARNRKHTFCHLAFDVRTRFEAYARFTPQMLAGGRLICKHVLRSTPGVRPQSHTHLGVSHLMCEHVLRSRPWFCLQSVASGQQFCGRLSAALRFVRMWSWPWKGPESKEELA